MTGTAGFLENVQPAVKKETKNVLIYSVVGTVLMWLAFWGLHMMQPERIPFDYAVILGGIGGCLITVLNFFLMGLTVQKIVELTDQDEAKRRMRASYSQRMLMQSLWVIAAIVAPCFNAVAGIIPLFFPGVGIKVTALFRKQ